VVARWALLWLDQAAVRAVAIRVIFGFPAATDSNGFRLLEFQDEWLNIGSDVRAVTERQVFASRAATVSHAFGNLSNDGRFDQIIVK
jgi:hypothetical protein